MNVEKQVAYWQNSGKEDWDVALELIASKRTRHSMFFAHLAIEKTIKAIVCQETQTFPPKTHNLLLLVSKTSLALSDKQKKFIARFDRYQLEGRYPDTLSPAPDLETAVKELNDAQDFLEWLTKKF
jgi:HEPN domain-containing protein